MLKEFPGDNDYTLLKYEKSNKKAELSNPNYWQKQLVLHGVNIQKLYTEDLLKFLQSTKVSETFEHTKDVFREIV